MNLSFLRFTSCDLSDETLLLSEIFPKLCNLEICSRSDSKKSQIITHFPHLKKLKRENISESHSQEFETFFNLNPHRSSTIILEIVGVGVLFSSL